ncbi:MAG: nicotinate-nucleotide--dimethylbenzimidazole phosphoribosyltransferase [Hyphomicrobium sp.]
MIEDWITAACQLPSKTHASVAEARQASLTKPPGSLGVVERLAVQLAAVQQTELPSAERVPIVIFAGDHGVTAQGISAFPSAVTVQMLNNFANGGAAISVLARELGCPLHVIDAGTLAAADVAGVVTDKPCRGTRDFSSEPAMTQREMAFVLGTGRRAVTRAIESSANLIILGEMGIGNTTSAAAIAAALLDRQSSDLVGSGTGLDTSGVAHKAKVITAALEKYRLSHPGIEPLDVLCCVGGLEIAALVGAIIASAQAGVPVLIDGFIVSVAALVAVRINSSCRPWLLFSHRSAEPGHHIVLDILDAGPILDLGLRLGEGSGAALALPILRLACTLHSQMATFEQANVAGRA